METLAGLPNLLKEGQAIVRDAPQQFREFSE